MSIQQMGETDQSTKDNLGSRDTTRDMTLIRNKEKIYLEEGSSTFKKQLIGTAFILGHPANAILGTSALGAGTMGSYTKYAVVNPNSVFHEHFRDSDFKDTTNTTASWDTTNFKIEFSPNTQAQTDSIFYNYQEISAVKLTITKSGFKVLTQVDKQNFSGGREVDLT